MLDNRFSLDESVAYAIARTGKAIKFELRRYFREAGIDITSEQYALLCRLWEKEGRSQKELAECSFKDTANITRMIDVLEGKGVVYRERDPKDRRTYRIYLTQRGKELKETVTPIVLAQGERAYSCLTEKEQRSLLDMLNRLYNHISYMRDNG
ncbi:MarR family winged helix-turn-helix transcriptional regulator [Desulfovibrio ferrophilus]|uniref:Transcriptional regulator n=1 Tax=Desulfovibrio ferrophilus TaxID=241368 RepID=A0A2Z6B0H6_9BACT|nr:MarR family transcriptional regulator [Desulfovibrio ferrophilus]BBD09019.1 transcriptional regulator [Desulfovibrio ferrophilus]